MIPLINFHLSISTSAYNADFVLQKITEKRKMKMKENRFVYSLQNFEAESVIPIIGCFLASGRSRRKSSL